MGRWMLGVSLILCTLCPDATAQNHASPAIPNLLVEISRDCADAAGSQVINKSDPFQTTKDRMRLIGMQQTNATVNIRFLPSSDGGMVELVMAGGTHADTDVYRRKVHLNMTTEVSYWGTKRLFIDDCGIRDCPADTHPRLDLNQLNCLSTSYRYPIDPLVRKIAYRVYTKQKPKIDQGVLDDAQKELRKQFDGAAAEQLVRAN